ncbi:MAG TPA: DUF6644 family protein [Steroidobacteraceae bacterium]|nr:DUF6644 family protein [Steroidobacteraceae bacterium]
MAQSVHAFAVWLSNTPLSLLIQNVSWIIPTVQTIHILSIAIVMSSVFMLHLRIIGPMGRGQPLAAVARRFLPWIWCTLVVLLLSGTTLIIGEPGRSLQNPAFLAKMSMLIAVVLLTLFFQRGLRRDALFWDSSAGRRASARLIAVVSLLLWVGILFAGRWIAYMTDTSA